MGLLKYFKSKSEDPISASDAQEISELIQVCEEDSCHGECENDEGDIEEGEAAFSKLKIDHETPLYNSSKPPKLHFVVPTSQIDWAHDACSENTASVEYQISKWCESHESEFEKVGEGVKFNCAVSSLPKNIMDIQVMKRTKNNVLVLPHFVWIDDLTSDKVDETLDKLVPELLSKSTESLPLDSMGLRLAKEQAFVFICSHMKRDKRCGVMAPYLKKSMDKQLQHLGLYRDNSDFSPNGVRVAFVNHVGGHKFSANMQIYLKNPNTLIWLGRVTPRNVPYVVNELIVPEKPRLPWPEKVRCLQKYNCW
ncbi:hypothetical protein ZYGR_0AG02560 [Zygosaccharomyces rouxii]|uniref:Actin patches distal protein 1 n=1 Tax=Zygosaccharomyces rouxii TaxID=4956 RepID=A0A1Q3A991_ZYGRO|nr:hypothetical protein ZYGR_0AG02560 [Zygosaccharomyces rouxii]